MNIRSKICAIRAAAAKVEELIENINELGFDADDTELNDSLQLVISKLKKASAGLENVEIGLRATRKQDLAAQDYVDACISTPSEICVNSVIKAFKTIGLNVS